MPNPNKQPGPDALAQLAAAYAQWIEWQGLPMMSADELIRETEKTTPAQREWLAAFSIVWDGLAD